MLVGFVLVQTTLPDSANYCFFFNCLAFDYVVMGVSTNAYSVQKSLSVPGVTSSCELPEEGDREPSLQHSANDLFVRQLD